MTVAQANGTVVVAVAVGGYANGFVTETAGDSEDSTGLTDGYNVDLTPDAYAAFAQTWKDAGASIVGVRSPCDFLG